MEESIKNRKGRRFHNSEATHAQFEMPSCAFIQCHVRFDAVLFSCCLVFHVLKMSCKSSEKKRAFSGPKERSVETRREDLEHSYFNVFANVNSIKKYEIDTIVHTSYNVSLDAEIRDAMTICNKIEVGLKKILNLLMRCVELEDP
ncbi:hypothetical protein NPIL_541061 [Nephila pilipes]|uniref:Uncharacterized protein n=1 Tax=Nephila pilipes TaxID=299642 RepID=A0A8X6I5H0_NEPPI|nr:hypothetical protein NPIL_541061 [Nephila pilipes]